MAGHLTIVSDTHCIMGRMPKEVYQCDPLHRVLTGFLAVHLQACHDSVQSGYCGSSILGIRQTLGNKHYFGMNSLIDMVAVASRSTV